MEEEIKIISQTIIEFQDSGRISNDALARIIIGNLEKNGYKLKKLSQHDVSISLERAKKYARHQHFLGTQGSELVEFEDWEAKD